MGEHKLNDPGDHDIKSFALGKYTIEMFPEGYIALNKELATGYHPKLEYNLSNYPVGEIDIRLATIATYVGIVMDGAYTLESRSELCSILAGRLEMLRDLAAKHSVSTVLALPTIPTLDKSNPQ